MKKILFSLLMLSSPLLANPIDIEGRVAAFYPQNKLFRELYGKWLTSYELEAETIFCSTYAVWGNLAWVSSTGHTSFFHTKTRFENLNASLGGKYLYPLCDEIYLYLGGGINWAFVDVHNNSHHVQRRVHKNELGGIAKLGLCYTPSPCLFFDIFADYLYQKMHFHKHAQIGGYKFGGGIGYRF